MIHMIKAPWLIGILFFTAGCRHTSQPESKPGVETGGKMVIYQVFTRLFGNTDSTNKPWGTIAENGVGKFNDFTDTALSAIKDLGVTHIWYTGVPHHALIGDYTKYGISNDDPDVVKGRAGSPYAVKDYYNVDPDLATDPARRLEEFVALIKRTHAHGMQVMIDIVPNHVARRYESISSPDSVIAFGVQDDTTQAYAPNNSFYYVPGEAFRVPISSNYSPLGGQPAPLSDGEFYESPAKWTGNGSRLAQPDINDWYETVKINYGVRPDGSHDFPTLAPSFQKSTFQEHYLFWQDKPVPASWKKMRDIAFFWLNLGVDGFRFDMAEMVPVEFWSYLNSAIKTKNAKAVLLAEVYNPALYRDYIFLGKMDYLYDKVEFYDTLRHIIQGHGSADNLAAVQKSSQDIEHHLLHFLENHDEQRIASTAFAGSPEKAKPAMVVSTLISSSPTLIYFGQEVGEPGNETGGYGQPSRTSIFDYVGVPQHQRWMNGGKFDGAHLNASSKSLRAFYRELLRYSRSAAVLKGQYTEIQFHNRQHNNGYHDQLYAFVRWDQKEKLIVLTNFGSLPFKGHLEIPPDLLRKWKIKDGEYPLQQVLFGQQAYTLTVQKGLGKISVNTPALESLVLRMAN